MLSLSLPPPGGLGRLGVMDRVARPTAAAALSKQVAWRWKQMKIVADNYKIYVWCRLWCQAPKQRL